MSSLKTISDTALTTNHNLNKFNPSQNKAPLPSTKGRSEGRGFLTIFLPVLLTTVIVLLISIGVGSVSISPVDILFILRQHIFGGNLPAHIKDTTVSVLLQIRLPRVLSSFLVGGILSVSGLCMQAVLQNPLASSYTLGVSSGASLGAALAVISGLSGGVLGFFLLPLSGFAGALLTVFIVLVICQALDRRVSGTTIILLGMVVSLFANALITLICSLNTQYTNRIFMWQMGSFAGRRMVHVLILFACTLISVLILMIFARELDILTFGDDEASSIGVDTVRVKKIILLTTSLMTGVAVCFTGTIGFVDLIVPHIIRQLYGPAHRHALPLTFFYGGSFLALADTLARTVISPREIPVGAVTALIGAPFFVYLYFGKRRQA